MSKIVAITWLLSLCVTSYAQSNEIGSKVNVKLNSSVLLGIINPAVEFRVFDKGEADNSGVVGTILSYAFFKAAQRLKCQRSTMS